MDFEKVVLGPCALYRANCLDVLPMLEADSIDAIVTDPPYGLSFMGKVWDRGVPDTPFWAEALRVAKPGAHLLAMGGTRTYHRLVCAIEDAGWEIRDTLGWVYGSGFPKSLDISKAIDKAAGAEREVVQCTTVDIFGESTRQETYHGASNIGRKADGKFGYGHTGETNAGGDFTVMLTAPATSDAARWEGWGTALKPALELIVLARKPLSEKTVAANVLRWGTGAWRLIDAA